MAARIRIACVGTGYFSRFHYRAWKRIREIDLVGVCNRNRDKAQDFADEFAIPGIYSHLPTMLEETRPDLLDIITPPKTHLAAITEAAKRGIDVICQKPFCATAQEAELAIRIAAEAGITIAVHENFRFQPWHQAIRAFLAAGRLGQIYQACFRLRPGDGQGEGAYLERQPYFRQMPRFLIHETAIHLIDVFRSLFGEAKSVTARLRKLNPSIAGEDAGLFILDMANGTCCVFDGNRLSDHAARNRRLTMGEFLIEGERGVLSLDGDGRLGFRAHGTDVIETVPFDWDDIDFGGDCVYRFQKHVIDHRLGRGDLETCASDYLQNIRIEEAIYDSNATGRRITI